MTTPPTWEQLRAIAMDTSERTGGAKNPEAYVLAGWHAARSGTPTEARPDDPKDLRVREALARLVAAADWKERSDFQDDYNNACLEMDAVIEYNNARLEFAAAMEAARSALALHSGEEI